jgi:hypothetical protein
LKLPILLVVCAIIGLALVAPAVCWSNGGYSADPVHPDYGTHDWIAEHALDYLPQAEKQYITDNLAAYLYGTELPDRPASQGGIGDTTKHHVYYSASGVLTDNASATRAQTLFDTALNFLKAQDYVNASRAAGTMTHYISDLAVFCHVMGANTDWGAEDSDTHSNYETYVNGKTAAYNSTVFSGYLNFDGALISTSAFNATKILAFNSTFGDNGAYNCSWMNSNYGWSNQAFKDRCGEALNLAVNAVADVLHTLYVESASMQPPTTSPSPTPTNTQIPTPTPTAVPMPSPTPTATPTPSPAPTPTASPLPAPTLTPNPTSTPTQTTKPTPTSTATPTQPTTPSLHPTPTPTTPEFPATTLAAALLTLTAAAVLYKKSHKAGLERL